MLGCRLLGAAALASFGLAGCDLGENFGDLGQQLLDPEVQGVETPGRRWVEGPHYNLKQLADEDGKRFVAAVNADSELVLVDFESEHYCRAGKVLTYDEPITTRSRAALIPVLIEGELDESGEPERWLSFTSFDCQRSAFAVNVAGLPSQIVRNLPDGSGTALLVRRPDGGLVAVDPWAETVTLIAGQVRNNDPVLAFGRYLWVDSGVIVISNERLEPIATLGSRVVAVTASPEDAQLAFVQASDGASGGTLFTVDARGREEPREIANDVCAMQYITLGERRKLSYLSPCSERQLVLRDVADDSLRVIDTNVAGPPAVRRVEGRSVLTYITTPSRDVALGTLWAVDGDADKVAIAENTRVGPSTVTSDGGLLTVLDWADNNGGRLVAWRGEGVTDVAQGVVELAPLGRMDNDDLTLLGNFDGSTGDLLWLRSDLSTHVLASGVPLRAANDRAFIANSDGNLGELTLLDKADGSTRALASGVARGAFIFTQQFNAVMMLARASADAPTNTLRVHLLRSKREYELHDAVTEAREVAFPSPGLLYNVVSGDDAGIWFAKAL